MTDLINLSTWQALSPAARAHLSTLLPRTAFTTHKRTLHPTHPSQASASTTAFPSSSSTHPPPDSATHPPPDPDTLDPTAFTDAHTLSALRTFQDHLYTGWLTPAHARKVAEYEAGVRAGTLHAPWKDEEWAEEHQDIGASAEAEAEVEAAVPEPSARARAGDAGGWKLQDLAKRGIVRAGDVLAYRRRFSHLDLIVEKDVFIDDIHPKSHALTLVLVRGPTRALPTHVVVPGAMDTDVDEDDPALRTVTVSTAAQIESAVLDLDGRVARGMRPNGNAWKTLTVWRWREDGEGAGAGVGVDPERGGRENHNTLFYLRGCYYHEQ
ncbi:hypothetical protein DENSPDRAFT_839763 [Dentipellis sp. KUC8613]|nr:hypothetical protein DENSPDRAFT_839763 [Dentipellis sp. KUC8613]